MKLTYFEFEASVIGVIDSINQCHQIEVKHKRRLLCASSTLDFALRSWGNKINTTHGESFELGDKIKVFWNMELEKFITSEHKDYLDSLEKEK